MKANLIGMALSAGIHLAFVLLILLGVSEKPAAALQDRTVPLSLAVFQDKPVQAVKSKVQLTKSRPLQTRPREVKSEKIKPVIKKTQPVIRKKIVKPVPVKIQEPAPTKKNVYQSLSKQQVLQVSQLVSSSPVVINNARQIEQQYSLHLRDLISRKKKYPKKAKRKRQQGTVIIAFTIYSDGHIQNISIKQSSGSQLLDRNAISTIQQLSGKVPFPDKIDRQQWTFTLPLVYRLY
jgi:protein TonB